MSGDKLIGGSTKMEPGLLCLNADWSTFGGAAQPTNSTASNIAMGLIMDFNVWRLMVFSIDSKRNPCM